MSTFPFEQTGHGWPSDRANNFLKLEQAITSTAVGREARARALPCPVVAVLEQTYKMNYESMIDAVVEEEAIEESKDIHG